MTHFNTPPTPAHWLPDQKRKPDPNNARARARIRAAIRQQRQNWANQIGTPPIPHSRCGRPWEPWEETLITQNQDTLTIAQLAHWTGRTPTEITDAADLLSDDYTHLPPPHPQYDDDPLNDIPQLQKKKQPIKETNPMPKKTKPTDSHIRNIYHNNYIGLSQSAETCATHLGYSGAGSFISRCKHLNLPLRNRTQSLQARNQEGQPWTWPNKPVPAAAAETAVNLHDNIMKVPTPAPEPGASKPAETLPHQPANNKKPETRTLILQTEDYSPSPPTRPTWLPSNNGRPTLNDISALVTNLREAGATVKVQLNINIEVKS